MERLPHWVIPDHKPAMYDHETATAIEMVAKLYGKTNELIEDYNLFVDNVNKHIEDYENGLTADYDVFRVALRQEFQDFIDVIELKVKSQDIEIADAVNYMKTNLRTSIRELISGLRVSGELNEDITACFDDFESQITALAEQHATDIESVNQSITTLTEQHTTDIESVNQSITTLTEQHTTDIETVNQSITTITEQHATDIETVNQSINGINDSINIINDSINEINTDIDSINDSINEINTDIDDVITGDNLTSYNYTALQNVVHLTADINKTITPVKRIAIDSDLQNTTTVRRNVCIEALKYCVDCDVDGDNVTCKHKYPISVYMWANNLFENRSINGVDTLLPEYATDEKLLAVRARTDYSISDEDFDMIRETISKNPLTQGADCAGGITGILRVCGVIDATLDINSDSYNGISDDGVYTTAISKDELMCGDIVGFDGHVGLYVGGGYVVEWIGAKYGCQLTNLNNRKSWQFTTKTVFDNSTEWDIFRRPVYYSETE